MRKPNPRKMLGRVLRCYRAMSEKNVRELGKDIGLSASTVCRLEQGYAPDAETMFKLWDWLLHKTSDRT